ncbi:unnamed protein product [[Candida] boidinii]|uniref:Unnamed protein product n=1 Tax=Candida boidinii TaxID=5477 RepID=A0A9W6SYX6_CANBO|nr:unnamed protein product [[Candida] boidinii]
MSHDNGTYQWYQLSAYASIIFWPVRGQYHEATVSSCLADFIATRVLLFCNDGVVLGRLGYLLSIEIPAQNICRNSPLGTVVLAKNANSCQHVRCLLVSYHRIV